MGCALALTMHSEHNLKLSQMLHTLGTQSGSIQFPVTRTVSGYSCVTSHRSRIEQGAAIRITFKARATAVDAPTLADDDAPMRALLTRLEVIEYDRLKESYVGGLDIAMMKAAGIDLDGRTSHQDLETWAERDNHYDIKNNAIWDVLQRVEMNKVEISGSLTVGGMENCAGSVHLFVKYGRICLVNGEEVRVVSANPMDLVAATEEGVVVDSWDPCINILPVP